MSSTPSAPWAHAHCPQLSSTQPSASTMPTYLPIAPYPEASPPKLSISALTDRIDTCIQTDLSPTALNSQLSASSAVTHPATHPATHPDTQPHNSTPRSAEAASQKLDLQKLAAAYSETCSLVWQQALTPSPFPPSAPIAERSHYIKGIAKPTQHITFEASPDVLALSLQTLCRLWAIGKCHHPDASFFTEAITLGALQAKWRYPAIQNSLRHTTANLNRISPYNQWLMAYPTCWSYAVGRTMHQILQWNYRLTATTLREFLILND